VNVLATSANGEYSFETFTNNSTSPLDASGTVLIKQDVGSDVQYSTDSGTSWTTISIWPVTLNNTDTANTLEVQFTTDLSFNSLDQYFILDSSNITIDGSNNVVNINVDLYQGLIQNGTVDTSGNSFVTIQNVGVESTYAVAQYGGWIGRRYFGKNATDNLVTNCYSTGAIGQQSGGIFGSDSSGSSTNCYSIGTIDTNAGGIFGRTSPGSATNCYSIGTIGSNAGGIFGYNSSGSATNCYSTGTIGYSTGTIGQNAGGIFGIQSSGSATNCYSTGTIGTQAGGIFGSISPSQAQATNCYSTGTIGQYAGGIFGVSSSGSATNCYSTGTIGNDAGGIFGPNSSGSATDCYSTDSSANWLDASANAALDFSGNPWTDIDTPSTTVPYLLTSFLNQQTLYQDSSGTDVSVVNSVLANPMDYTWSITSVNGYTSGNPGITIDASGTISFNSLINGVYTVNVLATSANGEYSFETFTNNSTSPLDASGTVLIQQVGSDVQYSTDSGTSWTTAVWPVTLNNTDTANTLEVQFTTDLSFNSITQYFILDSSNILIDGSNNVVNINVDLYQGLVQNGTVDTSGNSFVTIQNVGVESTYTLENNGGWIGQQYFGNNATDNLVTNCYSTGDIGDSAGGIFGSDSLAGANATNCYSTGTIGIQAGGIFGSDSSGSATNCYSTGTIGLQAGGIFGRLSSGSATNCYSTGTIGGGSAGGIFGPNSSGSATNCYYTNSVANWLDASANAALDVSGTV
jgi:hypothetical protein